MLAGITTAPKNTQEAMAMAKDPKKGPIVAIPVLLVLSFIFYVLSSAFFAMGGGGAATEIVGVADSSVADAFSKIQVAMRVMPTQKTEGNLLKLEPDNGTAEHAGDYDDDFSGSITEDYFTTENMEDYFPEFTPNDNTVPLGNAKPFCVHLDWATKMNRNVLDKYYSVQDLPQCSMAHNPKFRW